MVNVNEYFGGKVKSLEVNSPCGKQTVGVIEAGDYEFGTGLKEIMSVLSGSLNVLLPNQSEWKFFQAETKFEVPANSKFKVKTTEDTAYLCEYVKD